MKLLVVVIHREELLDEVLSLLVEMELPDSMVIESRAGLVVLERDLPIFAGLRSLIPGGIDFCRLVLCVVEDEALGWAALEAITALGDAETAGGGPRNTCLLLPISGVGSF